MTAAEAAFLAGTVTGWLLTFAINRLAAGDGRAFEEACLRDEEE